MKFMRKICGISAVLFIGLMLATTDVSAETRTYEVKMGDTLFGIAQSVGQSVEAVANLNGITSHAILQAGQTIILPTKEQVNKQFIQQIGIPAQEIAGQNGLYASVMIAQAILESDFGKSELASAPHYNLYGIKGSYQGQSALKTTNEYLNGEWTTRNEYFRSYPSYYTSLLNYASFLRQGNSWNNHYYQGVWMENTNSYHDATAWLESRYATDPNYASKLNRLISRYHLTQYDSNASAQKVTPSSNNGGGSAHRVQQGDTLYNIANRYGLSVSELQQMNQLHSNHIVIGQELNIENGSIRQHTVQRGDTLYNIAKRYGLTVSELRAKNSLVSNKIIIGQKLNY